jgi:hypothetical protein
MAYRLASKAGPLGGGHDDGDARLAGIHAPDPVHYRDVPDVPPPLYLAPISSSFSGRPEPVASYSSYSTSSPDLVTPWSDKVETAPQSGLWAPSIKAPRRSSSTIGEHL